MKQFLILAFIFLSIVLNAQFVAPEHKDSVYSNLKVYYQQEFLNNNSTEFIDTITNSVINTHPYFNNFQVNLGNIGTPQYSLEFQKNIQTIGFVGNFDHLNNFRFSPLNSPQYKVNKALTEFSYLNGTQEEERFSVIHVQNLDSNKNIGFKYQSQNSLGFYDRQRTQIRNFYLFGNYHSKNEKYYLDGAFYFNRTNILENGGITADSLFLNNTFSRNLIPVFHTNASNKSEQREYHFNHYYTFFDGAKDSSTIKNHELKAYQTFNFYQFNSLFTDLNTDNIYYSGSTISEGTELWSKWNYEKIDNKFGIDFSSNSFKLNGFLQQQFIEIGTYKESRTLQNQILGLKGEVNLFKILKIDSKYEQVLAGYNGGDGKLILNGYLPLTNQIGLNFSYNTLVARVPFVYNTFYANQLEIQNNFQKEKLNQITGGLKIRDVIDFEIGSGLFNNGVYFDSPFSATQSNTNDEFFFAQFKGDFQMKRLVWQTKLKYQTFANANLFPLPNFVSFNRFYLKGWIFDHHLHFNLGFDVFYASKYNGYGFSPLTRQFFLNSSGTNLGNYPFVDLFAAAKVKSARFYIKACHINQGFTGNNFYVAQNYPFHDFSLRLGFSWAFLN